jgi:hypothetical protein
LCQQVAYQRVQQPHASTEVKHLDRVEQQRNRDADEYDRIVQIHVVASDLREVEVHEQAEHEKAPTRELLLLV